jgi:predicted acetyltransferase
MITTSRGEPLHPYLQGSYVRASIDPDQMLRLVDVETALGYLERASEEPLVLDVRDDVIEENQSKYTIGQGKVVRATEAEQSVTLDVRQLAQLYAGYLPAKDLARHDLVQPSSTEALELLDSLFPVGDPRLYRPDHF